MMTGRFLAAVLGVILATPPLTRADAPNTDWQSFPSQKLTKSTVWYTLFTTIARDGPIQWQGEKGSPLVLRTAGLGAEISVADGPRLKFGTPVNVGGTAKYLTGRGWADAPVPERPLVLQWDAGPIGSPDVSGLKLEKEEADWAHCRLSFAGQWRDGTSHGKPELAITVSRLTPAVLLETNTERVSLFQDLREYPKTMLATGDRKSAVQILGAESRAIAGKPDWLLLVWGHREPIRYDLGWRRFLTVPQDRPPMLLVCSQTPKSVEGGGQLTLQFGKARVVLAMLPLYGLDCPKGEQTETWAAGLPEEVKARCDWWAARLAQYPRTAREKYRYDAAKDRVEVSVAVQYATVREGPAVCAPVPPILALARAGGMPIRFDKAPHDPQYRTSYGPYLVVDGATSYQWSIEGLARYVFEQSQLGPSTPASATLEKELAAEVDKILAPGPLAPWVYDISGHALTGAGEIYWQRPGETASFLARLLPVLDPPRRQKVSEYLKAFYESFPFLTTPALSAWMPERRERYTPVQDPPHHRFQSAQERGNPGRVLFSAVRGLADYCEATGTKPGGDEWDHSTLLLYDSLRGSDWATGGWCIDQAPLPPVKARSWGMDLELPTRVANQHLASLVGFLHLARLIGQEGSDAAATAWGRLANEFALRLALAKYARWIAPSEGPAPFDRQWFPHKGADQVRTLNQFEVNLANPTQVLWTKSIYHAYVDLSPEVGRFLGDYARDETAALLDALDRTWPVWHLANTAPELGGDSSSGPMQPVNAYSLFVARAWIVGQPGPTLQQRIDVSWLARGDLFYLDKLAETIKAHRGVRWLTSGGLR